MTDAAHLLPTPPTWPSAARRAFVDFACSLGEAENFDPFNLDALTQLALAKSEHPGFVAAVRVVSDLAAQGWAVRVHGGEVGVRPPPTEADATAEKERVRRQELLKRDEQLSSASVRRFIGEMEKPREFMGSFVSIFSLMRDGREIAEAIRRAAEHTDKRSGWRTAIDPYVQVVDSGERCAHTGLRLIDVWRYFRHTWTNQYTSTPGRTLLILVRDRAARFHPVIGIAALGSAIIQIRERDEWIGWQADDFLTRLAQNPDLRSARWIVRRLEQGLREVYVDDLLEDGLYWPSLWEHPTPDAIERLFKEADSRRRDHHRFVNRSDLKSRVDWSNPDQWRERAESDLFRSKRCLMLADLLRARGALAPFLSPSPSRAGLRRALENPNARRAIASVLRKAKAESVGTEIADLTVCGAVAPYNLLLGGKLVSMLAVSPTVVRAYHARYADYASEIASSVAGRSIRRRSNLVFVGTTSLYGSGSSQYNRVRIPGKILSGDSDIVFRMLGRSRSFGTSHLSSESVKALVRLSEHSRFGVRVNSIFGEGVNPKLRKVRDGLDLLGWPSDQLLQHRRQRIVYGVALATNLLPYLLGLEDRPKYGYRQTIRDDVERIGQWWFDRWLRMRVESAGVLADVEQNDLERPIRHGARVSLPANPGLSRDA